MTRVGIISRHACPNYGSCLQAHALQKAIDSLGFDSFYINYIRSDERSWRRCFGDLKESKMNDCIAHRMIYCLAQIPNYLLMNQTFRKAQKKYLKMSKKVSDATKIKTDGIDILCTGSDQVWNRIHNELEPAYFFDFLPDVKRVISYAASFGKDTITSGDFEKLKTMLKKYKHITVRECSGLNILEMLGYDGTCVVDPVLLYDSAFWDLFAIAAKKKSSKKYILVYQLHFSSYLDECLHKLNAKGDCDIFFLCSDYKKLLKIRTKLKYKCLYLPTIEEFVDYFKNAEFIITDSFHGTAFSVIFNKPFVDILPDVNSARNIDFLTRLGIRNRIVNSLNDLGVLDEKIEYNMVNNKLKIMREYSWNKLYEMLTDDARLCSIDREVNVDANLIINTK